jgi:hypothetical protein
MGTHLLSLFPGLVDSAKGTEIGVLMCKAAESKKLGHVGKGKLGKTALLSNC